jgi:hypothetical protein
MLLIFRVANPPGMGGRLPKFNSISRLPPDVAREIIISRNALDLVLYNGSILNYRTIGIVKKMGLDTLRLIKCDVTQRLSFVRSMKRAKN